MLWATHRKAHFLSNVAGCRARMGRETTAKWTLGGPTTLVIEDSPEIDRHAGAVGRNESKTPL
jgi:hypothetical protein